MKSTQCQGLLLSLCISILVTPSTCANSTLFEGGTVISFDEASQQPKVLYDTSILVTGDKIAAIFSGSEEITIPEGTEIISAKDYILSPGFVDTHRHGWQTAYKTLGSDTTLGEYFQRYGEYTQAQTVFNADDIYYGQLAGIYEALNSGVTSILEHAHGTFSRETSKAAFQASIDSGVRLWFAFTLHSLTNNFSFSDQVATFQEILEDQKSAPSIVELGLAYDEWTVSTPEMTQSVLDLAKNSNITSFTTHFLGGPWGYGNSPSLLEEHDFLNTSFPIIFSHASFVTPKDASLLRKYNQYISTTPESELHYGHDNYHNAFIQDQTALGVDTHSFFSTDIVGQARIWLQNLRMKFYRQTLDNWKIARKSPMSVNQAFLLATRSGGLALRRSDIGVLQVGAKADIVAFDGTSPNMLGWRDPIAAIILHSNVGDIHHVLVNGQWKKRDGKLVVGQNRTEVEQRFLESARRIQKIWEETPLPTLEGDFADGVAYSDTEIIDVVRGNGTGY